MTGLGRCHRHADSCHPWSLIARTTFRDQGKGWPRGRALLLCSKPHQRIPTAGMFLIFYFFYKLLLMGFYEIIYTIQFPIYYTLQTNKIVLTATLFIECSRPHYNKYNQKNQTQIQPINLSKLQHPDNHSEHWTVSYPPRHVYTMGQWFSVSHCYKYITINTTTNTLPVLSKFERAVMAWDGLDLLYVVPVDQNVYLRAWDLHVDKFRLSSCHIRGFSMIHPVPFP